MRRYTLIRQLRHAFGITDDRLTPSATQISSRERCNEPLNRRYRSNRHSRLWRVAPLRHSPTIQDGASCFSGPETYLSATLVR